MVDRYEELRRVALGERHASNSQGMAILLRHGMAVWSATLKKAESVSKSSQEGSCPGSRRPSEIRAEIVTMLAGMVLDCAREEQGNGRYAFEG
jgi:hypothetical protein